MTRTSVEEALERWLTRVAVAVLGEDGTPALCLRRSTGVVALDAALDGGLPVGRIAEVYGAPQSGKSSLALLFVRAAQGRAETVALVDADRSFHPARAAALGVDLERLVVLRPATGEDAFQAVDALVRRRACDLIVIDSVASLVPRAELEAPVGEAEAGLHARLLSAALRRLHAALYDARCSLVCVNQTRMAFLDDGAVLAPTGGHALSFYAATRLELSASKGLLVRKAVGAQAGSHVPWLTPDATDRAPHSERGSVQVADRPTKSILGHSAEERVGQRRIA